jgi:hypothetical protein
MRLIHAGVGSKGGHAGSDIWVVRVKQGQVGVVLWHGGRAVGMGSPVILPHVERIKARTTNLRSMLDQRDA